MSRPSLSIALCIFAGAFGWLSVSAANAGPKGTKAMSLDVVKAQPAQQKKPGAAVDQNILRQLSFSLEPAARNGAHVLQWVMQAGSEGRPILSGNRYRLVNLAAARGIKRQKRPVAANLGWLDKNAGDFNVLIQRQKGDGQVRYGDVVALNLSSYGWLKYKKQRAGINISDDDNKPHYIWVVQGGEPGMKIVAGLPFSLRNTKIGAAMIYCKRSHGIDLGWDKKSKCGGFLADASGFAFGDNGLFSGDGLTGKGAEKLRSYVCEAGVGALGAAIVAETGGTATPAVVAAAPLAIEKCKALAS